VTRALHTVAGLSGFSAVLLAALGSHALQLGELSHSWELATRYQLIHTLLLLFLIQRANKFGIVFVLLGILLFCGNIYLKFFMGPSLISGLIPVGGTCFMLAWLSVCFSSIK